MCSKSSVPIICLLPGRAPLSDRENATEFWWLSKYCRGFVLSPVWRNGRRSTDGGPCARLGAFEYYTADTSRFPTPFRVVAEFLFYVRKGLELRKKAQYQAIVAYAPFTPAWAGLVLRALTGARLIVDFPGNPLNSFLLNSPRPRFLDRIKTWVSRATSPLIARLADHLRLLYAEQLDEIAHVPKERISAFHYFTAISKIPPADETTDVLLCLGGPWYRKGVDVLIRAFLKIADEFPSLLLRIRGFGAQRDYFESLAQHHPRIDIHRGLRHDEAMAELACCRLFVCPSRSEGFPRVICEAMAAGRPIVAASVDGIPHYVRDGVNGLLFRSEDVDELADKMRTCLRDPEFAAQLGRNARAYAIAHLSEKNYADSYWQMLEATLSNSSSARCADRPNSAEHDRLPCR